MSGASEKPPVAIALAGAGLVGRQHLSAIGNAPEARLSVLIDPDPAAEALATEYGVPWRRDLEEALELDRPEAVILATPNQMHVEQGLACVAAGVPVLVEKPIADTAAAARRLTEVAEAAAVPVLVGHHRRHNPLIAAAKARIDAGEIGVVRAVNALCWLYKPEAYFEAEWRTKAGAGPVFINLIHDIDLLRHLVGEIAEVQAAESRAARGFEVEDTAAILLRFENGALGTVTVSDATVAPWSWELTAEENPAYPATEQTAYHIGGSHGAIEIPSGDVWTNPGDRGWWEPIERRPATVERASPLQRQVAHFCSVVRGEAAPLVSAAEGLRTLLVIEAIKRAAAEGGSVAVGAV